MKSAAVPRPCCRSRISGLPASRVHLRQSVAGHIVTGHPAAQLASGGCPNMRGHVVNRNNRGHPLAIALLSFTHRGKPPALPGDSPRFDLCDGLREFLISAKRKEIHESGTGRPAVRPDEAGHRLSRQGRLPVLWAPLRRSQSQATGFAGGI